MNVKLVINARVSSRDYKRLPFGRKTDVADKSLIQNSVDSFVIEMTTLGESLELRFFSLEKCHDGKYAIGCSQYRNAVASGLRRCK